MIDALMGIADGKTHHADAVMTLILTVWVFRIDRKLALLIAELRAGRCGKNLSVPAE